MATGMKILNAATFMEMPTELFHKLERVIIVDKTYTHEELKALLTEIGAYKYESSLHGLLTF